MYESNANKQTNKTVTLRDNFHSSSLMHLVPTQFNPGFFRKMWWSVISEGFFFLPPALTPPFFVEMLQLQPLIFCHWSPKAEVNWNPSNPLQRLNPKWIHPTFTCALHSAPLGTILEGCHLSIRFIILFYLREIWTQRARRISLNTNRN